MSERPNAQEALARVQSAKSMCEISDAYADLLAALATCASWTRLALIGAKHDWLIDEIARTELAAVIADQQGLFSFLELAHRIVRQRAALWSATVPEIGVKLQ